MIKMETDAGCVRFLCTKICIKIVMFSAIATPINTATLSQSSSDSTPSSRPSYQRTQYSLPRSHVQSDTHAISNTPTIEQMYSGHPGHATYETNTPTAGYIK